MLLVLKTVPLRIGLGPGASYILLVPILKLNSTQPLLTASSKL